MGRGGRLLNRRRLPAGDGLEAVSGASVRACFVGPIHLGRIWSGFRSEFRQLMLRGMVPYITIC